MVDLEAKRLGNLPSAAGGITRLAYAQMKAAGLDPHPLLRKAGLTVQDVEDPSVRVRVRDQIHFLNLVAHALPDDLLGFHLAQICEPRELGLLYYVSASANSLGEALQRAVRYSTIVNEGVCLSFVEDRDIAVTFEYVGVSRHLDRHQIEFFVTMLVGICRELTGQRLVPTRIQMIHRRGADSKLSEFFGVDVEFGAARDEVTLAADVKELPVVSADPYLHKLLIAYGEEALARRSARLGSFRANVEKAIVPLLPHGKARVADIARGLGLSQRTFARRLSLEGATFSAVLESLRVHLAERYLADDSLSISQIAWLLGYQEVSAFTHAFRRWTGKTPREARLGARS